ncbi:MAG TPA: ergothioneine biosynthesis protein EgtB [Balneolaceae bacterium]|nr:ergothioneine biosynthesis protein EgtB [Balneolaceae bacterium]
MDANTAQPSLTKSDDRHSKEQLAKRFKEIRNFSEFLAEPLEIEDYVIQAMQNTSPTKWHLAHVSWFYETFVLEKANPNFESLHPQYSYIFNSYYLQTGEPHTRSKRGLLSRPTVQQVYDYRKYVNEQILNFIEQANEKDLAEFGPVIEIGNHHEQQHQELMITDFKYMFAQNPLAPVYRELDLSGGSEPDALNWIPFKEGIYKIGNKGNEYTYDNEHPRHRKFLESFELADRLITNGEFMEFMEDDGYNRSELWLDDGWATVNEHDWDSPLYWQSRDGGWYYYTLGGLKKVNPHEPVTHLSYYEADAFARWAGARLPYEAEWEVAAGDKPYKGNFVEQQRYHPRPLEKSGNGLKQMFGDVWEWTQSAYEPYPGYKPLPGALGEYNGKFMCSQYVLRGGSCATSETHIRKTYRNFFYPDARWQYNGIRLARTV